MPKSNRFPTDPRFPAFRAQVEADYGGSLPDDAFYAGEEMPHEPYHHETALAFRMFAAGWKAALQKAAEPVAWVPHHHKRHPWAQPGDAPNRLWFMRFDDQDMREMVWHDENAEADAKAAYEKYSPAWNVYLFAAVPTAPLPQQTALVEEGVEKIKGPHEPAACGEGTLPSPSVPPRSAGQRLCESFAATFEGGGWADAPEWENFDEHQHQRWERAAEHFLGLTDGGEG